MKENVNSKGFTLVELLAVIGLLSIIAIMVVNSSTVTLFKTTKSTMKLQENEVVEAAKMYITDYCEYPLDSSYVCSVTPEYVGNKIIYNGILNLNTLYQADYLDPVSLKNVNCEGYVEINNSKPKAFIKCSDLYETEGYNAENIE